MITENFNTVIRNWLEAHPDDRDIRQGALLLLKLDGNRIRYRNIIRNPQRYADLVYTELSELYRKRISRPSEQQKEQIRQQARKILKAKSFLADGNQTKEFKNGKRGDHDSLPPEIQKLYEDNLELRHRMQQYHLQIRTLLRSKRDCAPDDLRDLCELLKKTDLTYHDNWKAYDNYGRS